MSKGTGWEGHTNSYAWQTCPTNEKEGSVGSLHQLEEGSVGSLHHLEAGKVDLAAFNYSEMDNLKIESDDNTVKSTKDKSEISVWSFGPDEPLQQVENNKYLDEIWKNPISIIFNSLSDNNTTNSKQTQKRVHAVLIQGQQHNQRPLWTFGRLT
jgi:hypothetical protein